MKRCIISAMENLKGSRKTQDDQSPPTGVDTYSHVQTATKVTILNINLQQGISGSSGGQS